MSAIARIGILAFVLLCLITVSCWVVAKDSSQSSPIQRVENAVAPFELKHIAETNRRDKFVITADQHEIQIAPTWARVELREDRGMGVGGFTKWNVSVLGWNERLRQALLEALNDSPATAKKLVEHPDERIQFLLLKVLNDWGHGLKSFVTNEDGDVKREAWNLKAHAVEALLSMAQRKDPLVVGSVISALNSKGEFSKQVFLAGMSHNSSEIRAQTLRWLDPERQKLTTDEVMAIAPVLIDHLSDRDLVVRQWSMGGLQSLVAYWEHSLGGPPIDVVRTQQDKMVKLPIAPASSRWYHEVIPPSFEQAASYQSDWHDWLTEAKQSL